MKKLCFFFLIQLMLSQVLLSQSCFPNGISFDTQQQIDEFATSYPNCTIIEGDVCIGECFDYSWNTNIFNLLGLSQIKSIEGSLIIRFNFYLENLEGLDSLESIGGDLEISSAYSLTSIANLNNLSSVGRQLIIENTSLPNLNGLENITAIWSRVDISFNKLNTLSGLDNLTSIGQHFSISGNDSLTNLSGLNKLSFVGSGIWLSRNNNLENLIGLDNLYSVESSLIIKENEVLVDLNGLEKLNSVHGYLIIQDNHNLNSINGIDNLDSIDWFVEIINNDALTNISSIENIDPQSFAIAELTPFRISLNDNLSDCAVKSICDYLKLPDSSIEVYSNNSGCNSQSEIEILCLTSVSKIIDRNILIYPNPSVSQITLKANDAHNWQRWRIFSIEGKEMLNGSLFGSDDITIEGLEVLPKGFFILRLMSEDGNIGVGKFIVE